MMELEKGTTLIEASAGTGKTYTLCRIALQLTLEKGIPLDRILAVTFTEAATEELAARIQDLYQTCLYELESGELKEPLLCEIAALPEFDREASIRALRYSLEVFDEAPISTIHSFCKRSLDLVALETGTPLDAEIAQVEVQLISQLKNEYIRQAILERSTALSLALSSQTEFEARLEEIGRQTSAHPDSKLYPPPQDFDLTALNQAVKDLPLNIKDFLADFSEYSPHLRKNGKIEKWLLRSKPELHALAERGSLLPSDLKWLSDFMPELWNKGFKASGNTLQTPDFVLLIEQILTTIDLAYQSLLFNYRTWLSEKLEQAKSQLNSISFNDLLHNLHRALQGEDGQRVARFLGDRYDAALIDEFQDTDRIQLQIARALFGDEQHYLFYIGDPKQAIYRFRGADIFAYFEATRNTQLKRHSLQKNFRSSPALVRAINKLFTQAEGGFFHEGISFQSVEAGLNEEDFTHLPATAMQIMQFLDPRGSKPSGKSYYQECLAERAANDFAKRLMEDDSTEAGDVAFLVNEKREAMLLSDALLRRGIAASIMADRSVFQTEEAQVIQQLLAALANPNRSDFKRGAYASLNRQFTVELFVSEAFEDSITPFFEYINQWSKEWDTRNFDIALQQLWESYGVVGSDSENAELERRYANLRQLSELLAAAKEEEMLSPRGLQGWLTRKIDADVSQQEDWQTRISSDERKPRILTVHKSKGLQFPIVILPFLGLRRIRLNTLSAPFHAVDGKFVIDYRSEPSDESVLAARREALAEDARLLYVALTRAERENLVYLGPEEMSKFSKLACSSFAQFILGEGIEHRSQELADRLQRIAHESGQCLEFLQAEFDADTEEVHYRKKTDSNLTQVSARSIRNRLRMPSVERVLSFSALNRSFEHSFEEESDRESEILENVELSQDEGHVQDIETIEEEEPTLGADLSIFSLPKGTRAGDLLHLILERFDFSEPSTLARTTQDVFESLQFEPRDYEPIVAAQISTIAEFELTSKYTQFRLSDLKPAERIPELEFAYPVDGDIKHRLVEALRSNDLGNIPRTWVDALHAEDHRINASMMRGFIDLVAERDGRFYIFDWKSNHLGPSPQDYGQDSITECMSEHNYYLQYLLYAVALKRFLEWRFPDENFDSRFGGVFYIFARGISPGKGSGVYYDLPERSLLEALDAALLTKGVVA